MYGGITITINITVTIHPLSHGNLGKCPEWFKHGVGCCIGE
jgi:hypothetical protein